MSEDKNIIDILPETQTEEDGEVYFIETVPEFQTGKKRRKPPKTIIVSLAFLAVVIIVAGAASIIHSVRGDEITIRLDINCKRAVEWGIRDDEHFATTIPENGMIYVNKTFTVKQNTTLLEILRGILLDEGIAFNETDGYFSSIAGISAGACGSSSGWIYLVDSKMVMKGMADYCPEGGQYIEIMFSTDYNEFFVMTDD